MPPLYKNFSPDPGSNNKAPPLGSPEGQVPFKVISDTFRTLMASDAEIGALFEGILPATETRSGIVELATTAEAAAGTDLTRAVHPAGVSANVNQRIAAIPGATTSTAGVCQIATATQFFNGSGGSLVVSPQYFAANTSVTNPGYIKIPGGLIQQFGQATTQFGGNATVEYPLAYTTFVMSLQITIVSSNNYGSRLFSVTNGNFVMQTFELDGDPGPAAVPFYWHAIGA